MRKIIAQNIKRLCQGRGISISTLERECGLANATIRKWHKSSPSVENLRRVADFFGVTIDYLIRTTEEEDNG